MDIVLLEVCGYYFAALVALFATDWRNIYTFTFVWISRVILIVWLHLTCGACESFEDWTWVYMRSTTKDFQDSGKIRLRWKGWLVSCTLKMRPERGRLLRITLLTPPRIRDRFSIMSSSPPHMHPVNMPLGNRVFSSILISLETIMGLLHRYGYPRVDCLVSWQREREGRGRSDRRLGPMLCYSVRVRVASGLSQQCPLPECVWLRLRASMWPTEGRDRFTSLLQVGDGH